MDIKLTRRYPNSRLEDINDAYSRGFSVGYDMGYEAGLYQGMRNWEQECKQLRDALRAILDNGEAPEQATKAGNRG